MGKDGENIKMAIEGSPSGLRAFLQKLSLNADDDPDPDNPGKPPPRKPILSPKVPTAATDDRCKAVRSNGERCRHTRATSRIEAELCRVHRNWVALGRPVTN